MKKLTDWLILLGFLLMLAGVIGIYRLPPKPTPNPQTERLQAIETRLERIEGKVQEIYDQQTYEAYMRDWRNQK